MIDKMRFRYLRNVKKFLEANDVKSMIEHRINRGELARIIFSAYKGNETCAKIAGSINSTFRDVGHYLAGIRNPYKDMIERDKQRRVLWKGKEQNIQYMIAASLSSNTNNININILTGRCWGGGPFKDDSDLEEFIKGVEKFNENILIKYIPKMTTECSKELIKYLFKNPVIIKYTNMIIAYERAVAVLSEKENVESSIKILKKNLKEQKKTIITLNKHIDVMDEALATKEIEEVE